MIAHHPLLMVGHHLQQRQWAPTFGGIVSHGHRLAAGRRRPDRQDQ
jgi:hypothetical protein